MEIIKILNNNVVVTLNENDTEVIVMGKGIAYKKKVGDSIPKERVDKVYTLSNPDFSSKFQELLLEIPIEHFKVTDEIISHAKMALGKKLNESIYLSMVDHIYTVLERFQAGIVVKNALLWDIRQFYKNEYEIGLKALDIIEEKFQIRLPEDEAGFLALHVVNAELEGESPNIYGITQVMHEIQEIVKKTFQIEFDQDSVYYYRFVTHLKFFAQRLFNSKPHNDASNDELFDVVKLRYQDAFQCTLNVAAFLSEKYKYDLTNEEKLYLTIHIARIAKKNQ